MWVIGYQLEEKEEGGFGHYAAHLCMALSKHEERITIFWLEKTVLVSEETKVRTLLTRADKGTGTAQHVFRV